MRHIRLGKTDIHWCGVNTAQCNVTQRDLLYDNRPESQLLSLPAVLSTRQGSARGLPREIRQARCIQLVKVLPTLAPGNEQSTQAAARTSLAEDEGPEIKQSINRTYHHPPPVSFYLQHHVVIMAAYIVAVAAFALIMN